MYESKLGRLPYLTMLAGQQGSLSKFEVCVVLRADDNDVYIWIREEVAGSSIVFYIRIVHGAVLTRNFAGDNCGFVFGCFCPLQDCINLEVWIWENERQIEALGREAIAYKPDIERSHSDE